MSIRTRSVQEDLGAPAYQGLPGLKHFFKQVEILTDQNNLAHLEPALAPHVEEHDYFYIRDFTPDVYDWTQESGVQHGMLIVQALHTTCVIGINELDEPCLLGDINAAVRNAYPKSQRYFHNSSMRTKNLCADDSKCDRNADAHLKSFLFGSPTQTLIIQAGKPVLGQWQRICLIDFDGPRRRKVALQILGE